MFKKLSFLFILVSLAFLLPLLNRTYIDYGQLGKQTFAAEMIKNTANGELFHGLFPARHFLEPYHPGIIPWAEEVPLYTLIAAKLSQLTPLSVEQSGKWISFISFIFLIFGFYRIKKSYLFAVIAALFPAFRLYSVEVMPDLAMAAACLWAILFALENKPIRSAMLICIASLFKYYAVFTGFGLGLFYLYRYFSKKDSKEIKNALLLILAILPCVLYIAFFIHLKIPNPITEYREADGHGHLASLAGLISITKWLRVLTWLFIKNSTLLGSLLAAFGLFQYFFGVAPKERKIFFICLIMGWSLFPLLFIESFYVHDYYGLQGTLGTALFAAFGLEYIHRRSKKMSCAIQAIFITWSLIHVSGMARPLKIISTLKPSLAHVNLTSDPWVMSISGISKPLTLYHLNLKGWMAAEDEYFGLVAQNRMRDPRILYASILSFKDSESTKKILADLKEKGFLETLIHTQTEQEEFYYLKREPKTAF